MPTRSYASCKTQYSLNDRVNFSSDLCNMSLSQNLGFETKTREELERVHVY